MPSSNDPADNVHPRRFLRRFIILSGVIGCILSLCVICTYNVPSNVIGAAALVLICHVLSLALCIWDLVDWKLKRAAAVVSSEHPPRSAERQSLFGQNSGPTPNNRNITNASTDGGVVEDGDVDGDKDPPSYRPRTSIMLLDLFFFIAYFYIWTGVTAGINDEWSYRSNLHWGEVLLIQMCIYVAATCLLNMICHMFCFWGELMAIKRTKWERAIARKRRQWEDNITKVIETAAVRQRFQVDQLNASAARYWCRHCRHCQCHARLYRNNDENDNDNEEDDNNSVARRVKEENSVVERIMRALGKEGFVDDVTEERGNKYIVDNTAPATASLPRRNNGYADINADVEAGPSYQQDSFPAMLAPLHSTPDTKSSAVDAGDAFDVLHVDHVDDELLPQSHPASSGVTASEISVPDGTKSELVKKKSKKMKKDK